jgi:hypothetical protein
MRSAFVLAVALATSGCAANHYDTYTAKNPEWYGEFPTGGASLHETLAGIYSPPRGDWQRLIHKLAVLELGESGARELEGPELDAVLAEDRAGDYGVVVALGCQSEYAQRSFQGEKVAWFLFHENRLVAYDSIDFAERCAVIGEFKPATKELAERERAVVAVRDADFPKSMEHVIQYYRNGFEYLRVGRVADARAMLERGDAGFDVSARGEHRVEFEGPSRSVRLADKDDVAKARDLLVRGLAKAEGKPPPGVPAP